MALMVGAAGKAVGVEHVPQLVQTSISNIENDGTVFTPLRASSCELALNVCDVDACSLDFDSCSLDLDAEHAHTQAQAREG